MFELFGKYSFVIITSYLASISLMFILIIQSLLDKWQSEKKLKKKEASVEKTS